MYIDTLTTTSWMSTLSSMNDKDDTKSAIITTLSTMLTTGHDKIIYHHYAHAFVESLSDDELIELDQMLSQKENSFENNSKVLTKK